MTRNTTCRSGFFADLLGWLKVLLGALLGSRSDQNLFASRPQYKLVVEPLEGRRLLSACGIGAASASFDSFVVSSLIEDAAAVDVCVTVLDMNADDASLFSELEYGAVIDDILAVFDEREVELPEVDVIADEDDLFENNLSRSEIFPLFSEGWIGDVESLSSDSGAQNLESQSFSDDLTSAFDSTCS